MVGFQGGSPEETGSPGPTDLTEEHKFPLENKKGMSLIVTVEKAEVDPQLVSLHLFLYPESTVFSLPFPQRQQH